jgi:hypothetical protein
MSKAPRTKPTAKKAADATLILRPKADETDQAAQARTMLGPFVRHGLTAGCFANRVLGPTQDKPGLMDCADFIEAQARSAAGADLAMASHMLAAQAITLDSMFTELARCAAVNMGEYPQAVDRYARLALKAQSNSRATLEALAKLHQPREQTVRHVHVNDGGQAIVAEQFHHHAGGTGNDVSAEQSHATGTTEPTGDSAALLSQDASRGSMPIPGGERAEAVPHARRYQSRSS